MWDHAPKRGSEGLKGVFGFLYQTSLAHTTESSPLWLGTGMHEVDVWLLVLTQSGCTVKLFGCMVACEHSGVCFGRLHATQVWLPHTNAGKVTTYI